MVPSTLGNDHFPYLQNDQDFCHIFVHNSYNSWHTCACACYIFLILIIQAPPKGLDGYNIYHIIKLIPVIYIYIPCQNAMIKKDLHVIPRNDHLNFSKLFYKFMRLQHKDTLETINEVLHYMHDVHPVDLDCHKLKNNDNHYNFFFELIE